MKSKTILKKLIRIGMIGNLQIHWNDIEWVVPRIRNVRKNNFCASYHKFNIKDKAPTDHWVENKPMKPIDVDEFFNIRVIISEL